MRRKDREITDRALLEKILWEEHTCRLGINDDQRPYLVPMTFGYKNNNLWFHSAKEGKKIELLKKNNLVSFEVESQVELIPAEIACKWSIKFYSVIGYGLAHFVQTKGEKEEGLKIIMEKLAGQKPFVFSESALEETVVIRVEIENMTGKKCNLP